MLRSMGTERESQLFQLCTDGNLPSLKDLITKQELNPNEVKDPSGLTPLHLACQHGHLDIVQYLIKDQDCNPETITTPNGCTPLHFACKSGHLHIIKCLITDHKCNPHCTDNDGYTPLHAASESGNTETVKYLITEQGCDPHVLDSIDNTPLHYASESGHLHIVQDLIANFNCDPQKTNNRGSIPLHYACLGGQIAVARYLIDKHQCSPSCTNKFGNTSLHLACLNMCLPLVKYLVDELHCDPQTVNDDGYTPLHYASLNGHLDILKYFISDCSCNPQCSTNLGIIPLHHACENGRIEVTKYLITEHKCSPEHGNVNGYTPLHSAASNGHLAVVKYLISELGCNPEIDDKEGATLIHYACLNGHLDITKYLISNCNCNPKYLTNRGFVPLHFACQNGHLEIAKYLITEHNCNPEKDYFDSYTPLHSAASKGHLAVVKYLITDLGCNPQIADSEGYTPLHYTCLCGHLEITKYLISDCNCNHGCLTNTGFSPLDCSCCSGHLEVAKYLITECQCNPCSISLHSAVRNGHLTVVKYLIGEVGCNAQTADNDGLTPLHYACLNEYHDIAKYLISECCNPKYLTYTGLKHSCTKGHLEYPNSVEQCNPKHWNRDDCPPLHSAVLSGHLTVVKYLISELNCNPQTADNEGFTPLHYACQSGYLDITKYLISDCNCNPEYLTKNGGFVPLHFACQNGHLKTAKYLITEHKCNPQHGNVDGYTPLHSAASNGHLAVVKYLLSELGCDPQMSAENDAFNPLQHACLKDVTKYFISDCNCNQHCTDKSGNTPLHCACQNGHVEVAQYLITEHKCNPEHGNVNGYTPIHTAASNGHLAVVKYLSSDVGCNPQTADNSGFTPLHYACLNGHLDTSKYLISDCSCNPEYLTNTGFSPLHFACENGHLEVAKYLITEHKCKSEHGDADGYTPLHSAARNGHLAVVKYLISELGCNPESADNNGLTSLHYACLNGHLDITKYLILECNCSPQCSTNNGFTPLHCACEKGQLEVAKYLITEHKCSPEHGNVNGITPLHSAAFTGHLAVVKYLICELGCNPQIADNDGTTPLHYACQHGHIDTTIYLTRSLEATKFKRDFCLSELPPLHTACMFGQLEIARHLVTECKYDPNCAFVGSEHHHQNTLTTPLSIVAEKWDYNNDYPEKAKMTLLLLQGLTPLHTVCIIGHLNIAKYLITKCRCDPNCVVEGSVSFLEGLTPLHIACMFGNLEIVEFLVTKCKCDPNCAVVVITPSRQIVITPLKLATAMQQHDIVGWLVSQHNCKPECDLLEIFEGIVCMLGQLIDNIQSNFFAEHMSSSDSLMFASFFGCLNIVKYLVDECGWDPHYTDDDGTTPLHFACASVQHLCEKEWMQKQHNTSVTTCTSNFRLQDIFLQIWHAIIFPVRLFSQLFPKLVPAFSNPAEDLSDYENISDTRRAIYVNRQQPYLDVVKYFINEHNCNPQCTDDDGETPLHFACAGGKLEIVRYFHNEKLSDLVHTSHSGDTPLHFACKYNQVEIVQFLLSTGECDPLTKNAEGLTPVEIATSPEISEQLDHFCKGKYPLESVVKVFVLGDPSAGKSSLVQGIKTNLGFLDLLLGRFQKVKGVRQQTAGIDSFNFSSSEFGNIIIYDFAGQREFHTSHAAFLQNYSTHKAGIFIIVINISFCEDDICQSLQYWMSFVQDCCMHNEIKPHIIIAGSHADQLGDMDVDQAFTVIKQTGFFEHSDDTDQLYEIVGIVCLDCTRSASSGMDLVRSYLQQSCDSVRDSTEKIDQRCYVLHRYVFKMYTETDIQGQTLGMISKDLTGNPYLLPSTSIKLLPLFQTLHDKGQVVLLENNQEVSDSWVITNVAAMLEAVVGSIFAPRDFPQHIAPGSTGIVPKSRISEAFPDLNTDMIIGFLEHFEFCHHIEPEWVGETKLHQIMSDDEYYLFPALLTSENMPQVLQENNESSYCCGWLMYSTVEGRFFTTRFLHVLLLRLAFLFALPQDDATPSSSKTKAPALSRRCNMWKNGISWPDTNGVKAIFEVKDLKTVIVKITCIEGREIHCVRLRTKLINVIVEAKNEFCSRINVEECIMEVEPGNFQRVMECPSHSIKYLSSMIANRDPKDDPDLILTHSDGSTGKRVSELLYFEPYAVFTPDLIIHLFAKKNAKQQVSSSFIIRLANCMYPFNDCLRGVFDLDPSVLCGRSKEDNLDSLDRISRQQLKCKHILETWVDQLGPTATYKKLRQVLNEYSIFCGRHPLILVCSNDHQHVYDY